MHSDGPTHPLTDNHGCATVPVIVRDVDDRYVFAGTVVPAAHVIGRVPIDDREALKARWPELNDEQINVAKMLALAHAIGEGQSSALLDEAVDDYLVNLRDNLEWIHAEIEAWKSLKAEVARSPFVRRWLLIGRAEAEVRSDRELEERFQDREDDTGDEMPIVDLLRAKRAERGPDGSRGADDLEALRDEQRRIEHMSDGDLMARYEELQAYFAAEAEHPGEDDAEFTKIAARLTAVENEQSQRWRIANT